MSERKDGPSAAVKLRVFKRDRFRCTYCDVSGNEAAEVAGVRRRYAVRTNARPRP
jgi:hypothetical protein